MNGLPNPFRPTMFDIEYKPIELYIIKPDYAVYIQAGEPIPLKYLDLYRKLKYSKESSHEQPTETHNK